MKWLDLITKTPEQRMIENLEAQMLSGIETMKGAQETIEFQSKTIAELTLHILELQRKIKELQDDQDS